MTFYLSTFLFYQTLQSRNNQPYPFPKPCPPPPSPTHHKTLCRAVAKKFVLHMELRTTVGKSTMHWSWREKSTEISQAISQLLEKIQSLPFPSSSEVLKAAQCSEFVCYFDDRNGNSEDMICEQIHPHTFPGLPMA